MATATDYGHMMAKSLILCDPNSNSNPNPSKFMGFGYKGLVFCRNNGWLNYGFYRSHFGKMHLLPVEHFFHPKRFNGKHGQYSICPKVYLPKLSA